MKSILITGCSSGIGLDAARGLKARGWRVFATCRQEADCERLRAEGLESFRLDYADEASIAAALDEVKTRTGGTWQTGHAHGLGSMISVTPAIVSTETASDTKYSIATVGVTQAQVDAGAQDVESVKLPLATMTSVLSRHERPRTKNHLPGLTICV